MLPLVPTYYGMRSLSLTLVLCLVLASATGAASPEYVLDSNTAFYEGETHNYVIPRPDRFRLITDEAARDGFSFAFIPEHDSYDSASVMITATIYRLTEKRFDEVLTADTTALREHYGPELVVRPVDSVFLFNGDPTKTFYVDDKTQFIPTVMVSYCDGGSEIVIFELNIVDGGLPRFLAESIFTRCLQHVKVLKKGQLGTDGP